MTTPIRRRLLRHNPPEGAPAEIGEDEIGALASPIVILGDPGAGKSVLMAALGAAPGSKFVRAGTLVRSADPRALVGEASRLVIDGVDEIPSNAAGASVEAVLAQLSKLGNPDFVISCRAGTI